MSRTLLLNQNMRGVPHCQGQGGKLQICWWQTPESVASVSPTIRYIFDIMIGYIYVMPTMYHECVCTRRFMHSVWHDMSQRMHEERMRAYLLYCNMHQSDADTMPRKANLWVSVRLVRIGKFGPVNPSLPIGYKIHLDRVSLGKRLKQRKRL